MVGVSPHENKLVFYLGRLLLKTLAKSPTKENGRRVCAVLSNAGVLKKTRRVNWPARRQRLVLVIGAKILLFGS